MRFFMVLFWSVLVSSVVSYVLTSMAGDPFNFTLVLVFAAILTVAILVLGEGILDTNEEQ